MKVVIIGGGPFGLGVAKALSHESELSIDLFEKRSSVGGLWNYESTNKGKVRPSVPSTKHYDPELGKEDVSPMYKHLETNLVKEIMQFKDFPFPDKCETFPSRQDVLKYVQDYSKTISEKVTIQCDAEVIRVEKVNDVWEVDVVIDGVIQRKVYDSVIIANGHFNQVFIPDVLGIKKWNQAFPGSITHAKYFDDPIPYEGRTVVVVGNSASGLDITLQISTTAKKVYNSIRDVSPVASDLEYTDDIIQEIGEIVEFDAKNKTIKTKRGEVIEGVDDVIYCTGYLYKFPFLKSYADDIIDDNGLRVKNLYKHMFYIRDPTLVFAGLLVNIIIFPFAECQGAFISRVLTHKITLPPQSEQFADEQKRIQTHGDGRFFHTLKPPQDTDYLIELQHIIDANAPEGFQAKHWDEYRVNLRKQTGPLKADRYQEIEKHVKKLRSENKTYELPRE